MENKKNYHEANYLGGIVENFIIVAIIFALVITVLDEFATVLEFSLPLRNIILILSCATDVIFTLEFVARLIVTGRHGAAKHYIVHQRGWIDLISSFPLLILSSGPEVLLMLNPDLVHGAGLGFMSSIKIVKAVRVSRILRLLRLLKVMGKIHNTDSQMANRHVAVISTIATMAFIVVYSFMAFAGITGGHDIEQNQEVFVRQLAKNIQKVAETPSPKMPNVTTDLRIKPDEAGKADRVKELLTGLMFQIDTKQSNIAQVYYKGSLLLSTISSEQLKSHYKYSDANKAELKFKGDSHVHPVVEGDVIVYLNTWPLAKERARVNIMVFFGIVAILLSFMFIYSRHFVQNVTDVVHIMQKGINDPNYNLEVSIRKDFEHDEIFELAKSYNEVLLPEKMKSKASGESTDTGGLSLDDFMK
jgi:Ion transport protein